MFTHLRFRQMFLFLGFVVILILTITPCKDVKTGEKLAIFYDGLREEGISHMRRDVGLAWLDLPFRIPREQ